MDTDTPLDTDPETDYNNSHRTFLQAFFARGSLTYAQTRPLLAACLTAYDRSERETLPNDITETDISNHIAAINSQISRFDFEFRSTLSQHDKSRVYALVNTTSDAITQLATIHSPDEIAFVKRVLDEMFVGGCTRRREVFAVESVKAVQCARISGRSRQSGVAAAATVVESDEEGGNAGAGQQQVQGQTQPISMHQAETLLDTLVAEGWFECSRRKFYSLAPRALMELRSWLVETYNEDEEDDDDDEQGSAAVQRIKSCSACKDIVTIGQRCPNLTCLGRLHDHCTRTMWRAQGGAERCPVCKKAWEGFAYVGERATREERTSLNGAGGRGAVASPSNDGDADDDQDDEDGG